jgi:hypothetical protein
MEVGSATLEVIKGFDDALPSLLKFIFKPEEDPK